GQVLFDERGSDEKRRGEDEGTDDSGSASHQPHDEGNVDECCKRVHDASRLPRGHPERCGKRDGGRIARRKVRERRGTVRRAPISDGYSISAPTGERLSGAEIGSGVGIETRTRCLRDEDDEEGGDGPHG